MSATASASDAGVGRACWRWILLLHRYLGIGVGVLVLLWCTSGAIMMYVQYPTLDAREQLGQLAPLDLTQDCCAAPDTGAVDATSVSAWRVESAAGRPMMRVTLNNGSAASFDLVSGEFIDRWDQSSLDRIGHSFVGGDPGGTVWIEHDQWTVQGRYDAHRPLRKYTAEDGTQWYLSSRTGEIVQVTGAWERFWNWPGAVTHWLYLTALRQHPGVWAQVVIWLTILSLFLTITGVAIGTRHFRWRGDRRRSPYRDWSLWHHYSGLTFGLMTLVWLGSGLLSMNPWGLLEGRSVDSERRVLNGLDQTLGEAIASAEAVWRRLPPEIVRLESAPWLGAMYLLASNQEGEAARLSVTGAFADLNIDDVAAAARALGEESARVDLLSGADAYYFSHHRAAEFPVYRLVSSSGDRFYLSALSGRLIAHFDWERRWRRWLFDGLHRGDLLAMFRTRPLWDVLMLMLLTGATAGVATGVYLAWRRIQDR